MERYSDAREGYYIVLRALRNDFAIFEARVTVSLMKGTPSMRPLKELNSVGVAGDHKDVSEL